MLAGPRAHSFWGPLFPTPVTPVISPSPGCKHQLWAHNLPIQITSLVHPWKSRLIYLTGSSAVYNIPPTRHYIPIFPHLLGNTFFPGAQQNSSIILAFWLALKNTHLPSDPSVSLDDSASETACSIHPSLPTPPARPPPPSLSWTISGPRAPLMLSAHSLFTTQHQINYLCEMVSLSWLNSQRLHCIFFKNNPPLHRMAEPSVRWFLTSPQSCCPDCPPTHPRDHMHFLLFWKEASSSHSGFCMAAFPTWSTHGSFCCSAQGPNPTAWESLSHQPGLLINLGHPSTTARTFPL